MVAIPFSRSAGTNIAIPSTIWLAPAGVPPVLPGDNAGHEQKGLSGFFSRAYGLLRTGGLLLTASRQAHQMDGELLDPTPDATPSASNTNPAGLTTG